MRSMKYAHELTLEIREQDIIASACLYCGIGLSLHTQAEVSGRHMADDIFNFKLHCILLLINHWRRHHCYSGNKTKLSLWFNHIIFDTYIYNIYHNYERIKNITINHLDVQTLIPSQERPLKVAQPAAGD